MNAHDIIKNMVGTVAWVSATEGYCECPGKAFHNLNDGRKDCKIYLNGVPTLFCFHASCGEVVDHTNKRLRKEIATHCPDLVPKLTTEEMKAAHEEAARKESLRKKANNSRAAILKRHVWKYDTIIAESPVSTADAQLDHWRLLLNLFELEDVVWIGGKYDSGDKHADHFRRVADWREEVCAPGQFVCPSIFRAGSTSRSNDSVAKKKFLVIESDELTRDEVGAVFKWLQTRVEMKLKAIVDTAGKSLHAWFEYPDDNTLTQLRLILPQLGCDPKLFTPSQPVRLPGAERDGKLQKLIYLEQEVVCAQ